jgi:hypothetical protein
MCNNTFPLWPQNACELLSTLTQNQSDEWLSVMQQRCRTIFFGDHRRALREHQSKLNFAATPYDDESGRSNS